MLGHPMLYRLRQLMTGNPDPAEMQSAVKDVVDERVGSLTAIIKSRLEQQEKDLNERLSEIDGGTGSGPEPESG